MAICIPGPMTADVRGSIGEVTFSRNFAGLIAKARTNPNQPESEFRDATQAIFSSVAQGWSGRLSALQRSAWRTYGARYPRPNRWGEPVIDSGYLAFIRCNCALKTIYEPWWLDVPPELGMYPQPPFTFHALRDAGDVYIFLNYPFTPLADADEYFRVSLGQTVNEGVDYYSSPWRMFWMTYWDGDTWQNQCIGETAPAWVGEKTKIFAKAFGINRYTGRLSVAYQCSCIIDEAKGDFMPAWWLALNPTARAYPKIGGTDHDLQRHLSGST